MVEKEMDMVMERELVIGSLEDRILEEDEKGAEDKQERHEFP